MPDIKYFLGMTNGDAGRIFATSLTAGRLIACWHFASDVSGVVVSVPSSVDMFGIRIPIVSENVCPVGLVCFDPPAISDHCALQASTVIASGRWISSDGSDDATAQAFRHAREICDDFGRDRLKILIRAMLMGSYTISGVRAVPNMYEISERERATWPRAQVVTIETPKATVRAATPRETRVKSKETLQ